MDESAETHRVSDAALKRVSRAAVMGELVPAIVHDVKQPLAAMITNAHAAARWLDSGEPRLDEARAALERIVRDGGRAAQLITRIQDFAGRQALHWERLDLNQTLLEALTLARAELLRNGVALRVELADGLPPVLGRRAQLQHAFLYLVLNGLEAIVSGSSRQRELIISSRLSRPAEIWVAVQDSSAAASVANFELSTDGVKIGLVTARSIIEAHEGRLWAAKNPGPGITVQFTLPADIDRGASQSP